MLDHSNSLIGSDNPTTEVPAPSTAKHHHQHHHNPQNQQILSIKNLFDIESTPISSESIISTSESNSVQNLQFENEQNSIEFIANANDLTSPNFNESNTSSEQVSESPVITKINNTNHKNRKPKLEKEVVLEVYQKISRNNSTESHHHLIESQPNALKSLTNSPTLNFNFEFDNNWSLEDLLKIEDSFYNDLNQTTSGTLSSESKIEEINTTITKESGLVGKEIINEPIEISSDEPSFENFEDCYNSSIIESFKELSILEKFKNVFKNNSSSVFKKISNSTNGHLNQSLLELFNRSTTFEDTNQNLPVAACNENLSVQNNIDDEVPKIKFQEYVFLDSDEKDHGQIQTILDPSISNDRKTVTTTTSSGSTIRSIKRQSQKHQQPKRKKSFLHLISSSTIYTTNPSTNTTIIKSILKNKTNENYNVEIRECLKQESIQFDEFWHNFEMNEQSKNNNYNEDVLNQLRLEQVRKYYCEH
ncbi:hypothetical protein KGF54_001516 [Candida jiufengensis]|uniref:uncharacterized protein n=1 Tax=Candida jiufengensis TaxID=497108 RepID=UPI002225282C|nr:uncharacterized protein KGF54_001516 [Candida jiufengensis]KAI5954955.1 hypothetical protein KGF54_001516 [Candida jiufengensis]